MFSLLRTNVFDKWLSRLKDARGKARIIARLRSAEMGNLADVKSVGAGVSEMRVHYGPGYRIYFTNRGKQLIVLLIGGDKSTQSRDIQKAKALAAEIGGKNDETQEI